MFRFNQNLKIKMLENRIKTLHLIDKKYINTNYLNHQGPLFISFFLQV